MSAIFTLDIGGKPILTFEAKNLHESSELYREPWLRDEVAQLRSYCAPLRDGSPALKTRYASEAKKAPFVEATRETPIDELIFVYLVRLDLSTISPSEQSNN
jgi:hypothetical protein